MTMEQTITSCLPAYHVGEKIGEGIYGSVYRVFDDYKERAVKIVPISIERSLDCRTPEALDSQVSRDFHAVKAYYDQIKGPGVIEIYDFHLMDKNVTAQKAEAILVILMQLCPLNLMDYVIEQYPLPPSAVLRLMRAVADVLQRLSEKSEEVFLLTDLKPSNILMDDVGRPLIGDLGGIKRVGGTSTVAAPQYTPNWSSPEFILDGATPQLPSVIFAFGLVSYFISEGRLPYDKENFVERIRLMKTGGIPFQRKKLPVGVRQLIAACLAHDPRQRPGSFAELVAHLNDISEEHRGNPGYGVGNRVSPGAIAKRVVETVDSGSGTGARPASAIVAARDQRPWTDPAVRIPFAWIPDGVASDVRPNHHIASPGTAPPAAVVAVSGFWMSATLITQGQWRRVMGSNPSMFAKGENYPVETVSWEQCIDFLRRLAALNGNRYLFTLPTEIQWQYAATDGGCEDPLSVPADIDQQAWHRDNSGMSTQPVGLKQPNDLGLYDLLGNVMEWCGENAAAVIYRSGRRRRSIYADVGTRQPGRGGSWKSAVEDCRPAHQRMFTQQLGYATLGLRVVRLPGAPGGDTTS